MRNRILARSLALVFIIVGFLLTYFALQFAFAYGLVIVLLAVFLISVLFATGVFLFHGLDLKQLVHSLALGGCAELVVGMVFLTPFSLEIKLLLVNIFLVVVVVIDRYYAKTRNSSTRQKD